MVSPYIDINGLESIVQKSSDGLIVVDEKRIIRFINPAAETILNISNISRLL